MHSLGDVWHPGSGVPCFGGFAAFAAFGGSQSHFLPCSRLRTTNLGTAVEETPTAVPRFLALGVGGRGGSP